MTSDIALTRDAAYLELVRGFADNLPSLSHAFSHAWYKLTSRDMGPYARCSGPFVPPPQPWQYPLPAPPLVLPNFNAVRRDIVLAISTAQPEVLPPDVFDGQPYYGALFVRLAWQCASTFRVTDFMGGCNGARIRYPPQREWPVNVELDNALTLLQGVKDTYAELSWADLIVLAGTTALEEAGAPTMTFCGGRTDAADDDNGAEFLTENFAPMQASGSIVEQTLLFKRSVQMLGLTMREVTALMGAHSLGKMHEARSGFDGAWTLDPTVFSNGYFVTLLTETWEPYTVPGSGNTQYKAQGQELYALQTDVMLRFDPELAAIAQDFASDNDLFLAEFAAAWTKVVNADRFANSTANLCAAPQRPVPPPSTQQTTH